MDQAQELPSTEQMAVDAVYFNGGNADGTYFVAATARRQNRLTQTILIIRLPGFGILQMPNMPDTSLYREQEMEYTANGLHFSPVQPMKEWRLSYNGKMRLVRSVGEDELIDVKFDLKWQATTTYFDFDTDLNVTAMSSAMAREKWSREFFDKLRRLHQTHYEQFGEITGTVDLGKYNRKEIKVQGVRDHSYGNLRDWNDLYRYAIQYIHLEDKMDICIGSICMPQTTSRLIIGNVFHPDGKLDTVSSTDIELYAVGEDGRDPDKWNFTFTAGNKNYNVKCEVQDRAVFYMGLAWEARIVERMCKFTVNGVKGWGISEWDYHNKAGKKIEEQRISA